MITKVHLRDKISHLASRPQPRLVPKIASRAVGDSGHQGERLAVIDEFLFWTTLAHYELCVSQ